MAQKNLSVKLSLNDKQFQSNLRKSTRSLKKFGDNMKRTGDTVLKGFTAPLLGLGVTAVKLASDFEETQSKFNTVFKDIRSDANLTAKNLSDNFGLSSKASLQLLSDTGDLLTGFGFTQEEALKLSKEVNELAVDLASFNNLTGGAEQASQALTKALLGERESIKQLGIVINEADLKSFAEEQGLVFKELDRVAKATLTYQLALKQSQNAVGDFARTSDSFANQLRQLQGELQDVGAELGVELLPVAKQLVNTFRDFTKFLGSFTSEQKQAAIATSGYVSAAALALSIVGRLITAFSKLKLFFFKSLIPVLKTVKNAFMLLTPQGRVIGLALSAATLLTTQYDKVVGVFNRVKEAISGVKKEQEGLDFSVQNQGADPSAILAGMTSGSVKNPVTGKAFTTPKPKLETFEKDTIKQVDSLKALNVAAEDVVHTMEKVEFPKELDSDLETFSEAFFDFSEKFKQSLLDTFQNISQVTSQISSLFNQQHQNKMQSLENEEARELKKIEASMLSEEAKEKAKEQLEEKFAKKKKALDAEQAARAKAIAILEAIVNTASAVVKALPNIPLSIAVGAIGAAQIGTIASAPLPAFKDGGIVSGPTMGLIGEYPGASANPEVIAPLDKLKNMIGGTGGAVQVFGTISGSDILLSSDRAKNNRNRTRGY